MTVDGRPFEVKGVGMGYADDPGIAALAAAGGTAFRTWESHDLDVQLAAARRHGLMVLVGLDVKKQLQGFDYRDAVAVASQHAEVSAFIDRYKEHPSVLGWIVANEPNLMFGPDGSPVAADPAVYDALGDLVDHIHARDGRHPATIALAFTPTLRNDIATMLGRIPDLDFVSFQAYGALPAIPALVEAIDLDRPFMVTEYGPLGHWEMPSTAWGREIEEPSAAKAAGLGGRIRATLADDTTDRLIGHFAFLWGQKQERTPTWYGLFTPGGEKTASVDELQRFWTGAWPANRAPATRAMTIDGAPATSGIRLVAGTRATARVEVDDPEGDVLETRWTLLGEVSKRSEGGHFEAAPPSIPVETVAGSPADNSREIVFLVPGVPGEYRLFATTSDGAGGAGTANIPFIVEAP